MILRRQTSRVSPKRETRVEGGRGGIRTLNSLSFLVCSHRFWKEYLVVNHPRGPPEIIFGRRDLVWETPVPSSDLDEQAFLFSSSRCSGLTTRLRLFSLSLSLSRSSREYRTRLARDLQRVSAQTWRSRSHSSRRKLEKAHLFFRSFFSLTRSSRPLTFFCCCANDPFIDISLSHSRDVTTSSFRR